MKSTDKTATRRPMKLPRVTFGESRNPSYSYANQTAIRNAFWEFHPQFTRRGVRVRQNAYPCDVRVAFVEFVDGLERSGELRPGLAQIVTL